MQKENNVVKTGIPSFDTTRRSGEKSFESPMNGMQSQKSNSNLDQKIRNALGRPVTRVISDRENNIILNIGDLITYQAVNLAIQADVLDRLLDAVYQENLKH